MKDRIVRLDIADSDEGYTDLLGTFYLINPDTEKLNWFKAKMASRFDDEMNDIENPFSDTFDRVYEFIENNFETVEIETERAEW